jgi:hypothetical protein
VDQFDTLFLPNSTTPSEDHNETTPSPENNASDPDLNSISELSVNDLNAIKALDVQNKEREKQSLQSPLGAFGGSPIGRSGSGFVVDADEGRDLTSF